MTRGRRAATTAIVAVVGLVGAACGDDGPTNVDFEVIEETTFDPSLSIDLDAMTRTSTGVYWEDLVVGAGTPATFGTTPLVTYTLWLSDGSEVQAGTFSFLMGNNRVIAGFEDGIVNTRTGGTRKMVIPPNRGYGAAPQTDSVGNVIIPAGSVLIFEVTVDSILG